MEQLSQLVKQAQMLQQISFIYREHRSRGKDNTSHENMSETLRNNILNNQEMRFKKSKCYIYVISHRKARRYKSLEINMVWVLLQVCDLQLLLFQAETSLGVYILQKLVSELQEL